MKKSRVIILISVALSVLAAVGTTVFILKKVRSKSAIAPADLEFETDFDDLELEESSEEVL